jgi:hypothetical protein
MLGVQGGQPCAAHAGFIFPIMPPDFRRRHGSFRQVSDSQVVTSIKHIHFYLASGAPFAFLEGMFSQNQGQGNSADHTVISTQLVVTRN